MIYSVWVPEERGYNYYSVGEAIEDDTPAPSVRGSTKIGCAPGEATWLLPAGARPIGSGPRARGVVVHPASLGGLDLAGGGPLKWVLYAGLAYVAYKVLL